MQFLCVTLFDTFVLRAALPVANRLQVLRGEHVVDTESDNALSFFTFDHHWSGLAPNLNR